MNQHYGVLRIIRIRPPVDVPRKHLEQSVADWLPAEHLVHLLKRRETSIGRALNNDLILMDPAVSREHARLVLDEQGWRVVNLSERNVVRVNGHTVPGGSSFPLRPLDYLVLGGTTLQLLAPQSMVVVQTAGDESEERALTALYQDVLPEQTTSGGQTTVGNDSSNGDGRAGASALPLSPLPSQDRQLSPAVLPDSPADPGQNWPVEDAGLESEDSSENLLGVGVTMQFALRQRLGKRVRWLIAAGGITILLLSILITLLLYRIISFPSFSHAGPASWLTVLTIPIIPALGINLLVNFIDRFEREPWFLRLAAFLWGAVIAIPTALLIEQNVASVLLNWLGSDALTSSIIRGLDAGVIEETVKGLGLLLLFLVLRDEFDNITDGIVYGALIGAGLAMVENFVYFAQYSSEFLPSLIISRIVLGWFSHSTFTICFGAALGYVRHTRVRWLQITVPLLGYCCAVGLHSVFDFISYFANALQNAYPDNASIASIALIAIIGDYIPPFAAQVILLYVLIKALVHEEAVIREFLASEVNDGVVLVDEYVLLQDSFQRTRVERSILRRCGVRQWLRIRALYQTEIGLAFRKWHVSMGDRPKLGYMQPEDAYRRRIKRLRKEFSRHLRQSGKEGVGMR
ncbi:MAG: PrsW family intramembrane metalloprotease [Ktedonobacteraceae bacterium]|nr:PrsW family intramembrane metalloprotease [Ktedonobacteraceae bacterium]